jgi:hypothetical protein
MYQPLYIFLDPGKLPHSTLLLYQSTVQNAQGSCGGIQRINRKWESSSVGLLAVAFE